MNHPDPNVHPPVRSVFTRDQMLTWPNAFTFVRLLCIPLFVWLLFGPQRRDIAAWLLAFLGATDWVDGWIARRFDQASEFGRLFDPTVDRLMFFVAVPAIMVDGSIPLWVGVLVMLREVLVAVCAVASVVSGAGTLEVTWEGKVAAFSLMFAVPMFLGANSTLSYADVLQWMAWVFVAPGLAYGYYSLVFQYLPTLRDRMGQRS